MFQYTSRLGLVCARAHGGDDTEDLLTNLFPGDDGDAPPFHISDAHLGLLGYMRYAACHTAPAIWGFIWSEDINGTLCAAKHRTPVAAMVFTEVWICIFTSHVNRFSETRNSFRVLVVGGPGVGKRSLAAQYALGQLAGEGEAGEVADEATADKQNVFSARVSLNEKDVELELVCGGIGCAGLRETK
jgi:hypothetical protein